MDWLRWVHTCARALALRPFVDTCFPVSLHPHHTLLFMSLALTCSSSVTHLACSTPGSICVCNVWSTWSPWWQEVGKAWLYSESLPLLPGRCYIKRCQEPRIKKLGYQMTQRNFWNGGKGQVLSPILSNVLSIYCLIWQVDSFGARR